MPRYQLPCLTCANLYEVDAPDLAAALQAGRAAGRRCPSCVDEVRFAAGIATAAIDEPYDVPLVPARLVIPEPDACDDVVREAFIAQREAAPAPFVIDEADLPY